jgi:hypothetical protein
MSLPCPCIFEGGAIVNVGLRDSVQVILFYWGCIIPSDCFVSRALHTAVICITESTIRVGILQRSTPYHAHVLHSMFTTPVHHAWGAAVAASRRPPRTVPHHTLLDRTRPQQKTGPLGGGGEGGGGGPRGL